VAEEVEFLGKINGKILCQKQNLCSTTLYHLTPIGAQAGELAFKPVACIIKIF
jgi:hypothetical protein